MSTDQSPDSESPGPGPQVTRRIGFQDELSCDSPSSRRKAVPGSLARPLLLPYRAVGWLLDFWHRGGNTVRQAV